MKQWKKILFTSIFLSFVFVTHTIVLADSYGIDDTVRATGGALPTSIGGASSVPQFVGVIIRAVLAALGIVFFFLVFYAGILWMTARGNQAAVDKSKGMIEAAVVGLVIVSASYAITRFIFQNLGGQPTGTGEVKTEALGASCQTVVDGGEDLKDGNCVATQAACTNGKAVALEGSDKCAFCCVK